MCRGRGNSVATGAGVCGPDKPAAMCPTALTGSWWGTAGPSCGHGCRQEGSGPEKYPGCERGEMRVEVGDGLVHTEDPLGQCSHLPAHIGACLWFCRAELQAGS